jgi:nicotinamidase-related amidase
MTMTVLIEDSDSILAVIDTQPAFLEKLDERVAKETVDRVRWLVKLAGLLEIPIVVTEERPESNSGTAKPIEDVLPDTITHHNKPAFSVAACPSIMVDLESHGRRTAVLCGLETDVCIAQSAIGLRDAGWKVIVVEDAVASPGAAHDQGLARMREAGVELVGIKSLCYEWLRTLEKTDRVKEFLTVDQPMGITM